MTDLAGTVECSQCGHLWKAQWPEGARKLECPLCHGFTQLKPRMGLRLEVLNICVGMAKESGYASPASLCEDVQAVWESGQWSRTRH